MDTTRGRIVKAAAVLIVLELLGQASGLVKQVLIAAWFGTSQTMDAYLIALTLVGLVRVWLSLPIDQTLIPMFRYDLSRRGEQVGWGTVSVLLNNLGVVLVLAAAIGWLLSPYLVSVVAPGLATETRMLAGSLARIAMASLVFGGLARVLSQILFTYERFVVAGAAKMVDNLVIIAGLCLLGGTRGIYALAIAVVLGKAAECLLQLPTLWDKLRRFYSFRVDLRHPGMIEMGALSVPLLVAAGGTELERVTDRIFASLLPVGSLAALAFAHRLISLPADLLIDPLQKSTFPHFARLSAEQDFTSLSRHLGRYVRAVLFLVCPIAVGMVITADVMVRAVYQRGAFNEESVLLTSQALALYALGFPAACVARVLNRTFFGLKDTRTPTKVALGRIGLKIGLSAVLIRALSHRGLALAESLSQIVRVFFLFYLLPKEVKRREAWPIIRSVGRTMAVSGLMAVGVYGIGQRIDGWLRPPVEFGGLLFVGVAIYAATSLLFVRGDEAQELLKAARNLGGRWRKKRGHRR